MAPSTPPFSQSLPLCVPYDKATPHQISLALTYVMEALAEHFPTLSFVAWASTLLRFKPDIWVAGDAVSIDYQDLQHLTQQLAASEELPELAPPIYPDRAVYVFQRFANYQDEALEALPDIAANPLAYSHRVFTLVTNLALGNAVVDEVFHATHRAPQGRPGSADPALARATVHEQIRALRRARGEVGHLAIPERPAGPAK